MLDKWLIVYDKFDIGFHFTFSKNIGFHPYHDFIFYPFNESKPKPLPTQQFHKIFINLPETHKNIIFYQNLPQNTTYTIFSSCSSNLTNINIFPIQYLQTPLINQYLFENIFSAKFFIQSIGINMLDYWKDSPEEALQFSNLALYECLQNKQKISLDPNSKLLTLYTPSKKLFALYNAFTINLPLEISLSLANCHINNNNLLEINSGLASSTLLKLIL